MEHELLAEINELKALLQKFVEECPTSAEFSDWPELQELVDEARSLLG